MFCYGHSSWLHSWTNKSHLSSVTGAKSGLETSLSGLTILLLTESMLTESLDRPIGLVQKIYFLVFSGTGLNFWTCEDLIKWFRKKEVWWRASVLKVSLLWCIKVLEYWSPEECELSFFFSFSLVLNSAQHLPYLIWMCSSTVLLFDKTTTVTEGTFTSRGYNFGYSCPMIWGAWSKCNQSASQRCKQEPNH